MKLILIVEDEHGNAEVLRMIFEAQGHRVALAAHGKNALELLGGERPAVILSDFMMPHMNGAELGATLRADSALCDIPFVFMSGTNEDVVRRSFGDYDAFVRKPCDIDALLKTLEQLMNQGRPVRPRDPDVDESMRQLLRGMDIPPDR